MLACMTETRVRPTTRPAPRRKDRRRQVGLEALSDLAALYVLADGSTLTIGELAESINRSPSATSRLIDGLVKRRLVERRSEEEDRRQKVLRLTPRGHAILRVVDRGRAEQFLSAVRPLPTAERSIVAMGVAALATHAINRRGRLIRATREPGT